MNHVINSTNADGIDSDDTIQPTQMANMLPDAIATVFSRNHRTLVLIDGANTYQSSRVLNFDIDYKKLRELLNKTTDLLRTYYFTVISEVPGENMYNVLKPLTDWMSYNNYSVVVKTVKSTDAARNKLKPPLFIDVELTVVAMQQMNNYDTLVLFSGDGDFCPLVEVLKAQGKRVIVVSTLLSDSVPILSDNLRRAADHVVFLEHLIPLIQRDPSRIKPRRTSYGNVRPATDDKDSDSE